MKSDNGKWEKIDFRMWSNSDGAVRIVLKRKSLGLPYKPYRSGGSIRWGWK